MDKSSGIITEIHRLSTHDGPGLRTTVFFKGCSLHCQWCQNPETIDSLPHLEWDSSKCLGCSKCMESCPDKLVEIAQTGLNWNKDECIRCGSCTNACPSKALSMVGKKTSTDELMKEIKKDSLFFHNSGGGVTISGGEPLLQIDFLCNLINHCKSENINVALDTSAAVSLQRLLKILPNIDYLLMDIKEMDPNKHSLFTGSSNETILNNISALLSSDIDPKPDIWIRTPLIPGYTATEENIKSIAKYLNRNYDTSITKWELCTFNNLCEMKYRKMGIQWALINNSMLKKEETDRYLEIARERVNQSISVSITGMTEKTTN